MHDTHGLFEEKMIDDSSLGFGDLECTLLEILIQQIVCYIPGYDR